MTKYVLVVDDDPLYIDLVRDIFSDTRFKVLSASNGSAALDLLKTQPVDLIVSDVEMPVMDGVEFHSRVVNEKQLKAIPFVFITGAPNSRMRKYLEQHGDISLFQKADLVKELGKLSRSMAV